MEKLEFKHKQKTIYPDINILESTKNSITIESYIRVKYIDGTMKLYHNVMDWHLAGLITYKDIIGMIHTFHVDSYVKSIKIHENTHNHSGRQVIFDDEYITLSENERLSTITRDFFDNVYCKDISKQITLS